MGQATSRNSTYEQYYEALKKHNPEQARNVDSITDISTLNPYEVLGVAKDFEWDELKAAYKRIAKLVHPDKGGSEKLFNSVTECFRTLAHEYKARQEKNHNELRAGSREAIDGQQSMAAGRPPPAPMSVRGSGGRDGGDSAASFQERFNSAFESNRLDDDDGTAVGYGSKMAQSTKVREDFSVPRVMKKFEARAFNKVFDAVTLPTSTEVIRYREPEALPIAKNIQYTELGKATTDDFSSTTEGEGRRTLQYTDYMKAHTTTRLVDPRAVQNRQQYKTVSEYESARDDARDRPVTEEEMDWRRQREEAAERVELERQKRLGVRDRAAALHHERVTRLMLGN